MKLQQEITQEEERRWRKTTLGNHDYAVEMADFTSKEYPAVEIEEEGSAHGVSPKNEARPSSMALEEEKGKDVLESVDIEDVDEQVVTRRGDRSSASSSSSTASSSPEKELGSTSTLLEEEKGKGVLETSVDTRDPGPGWSRNEWLSSVKQKLDIKPRIIKPSSTQISCSIHRVPQCFLQHYEKAYVPQVISIGPFHYARRERQLRAMEEHKWMYLRDLVKEENNCFERWLQYAKRCEIIARECYSEEINLDADSFAEMMVLDACFLIELFRKAMDPHLHQDDPILKFGWLKAAITTDLLMLENQIPFFIMKDLSMQMGISNIEEMALAFFSLPGDVIKILHLLHLLHCSRLPRSMNGNHKRGAKERINNASKLRESGIKFKKGDENGYLDIRFEKGVITIPPLKVEDTTNPLLLNLVAFEQCYRHVNSYFAGYTYFMDCLIDTANDVKILCENGIIDRWLGGDKDVANLFNKIGREVIVYDDDFYLSNVCNQINRHHRINCNVWLTTLKRTKFNNPWAIISVFAGVILLLLTVTQTFFAVAPKFAHGH